MILLTDNINRLLEPIKHTTHLFHLSVYVFSYQHPTNSVTYYSFIKRYEIELYKFFHLIPLRDYLGYVGSLECTYKT
jgi:hypothetical protein